MKKNPGSLSEGNLNTDSVGFKIPPSLLVKKTMKKALKIFLYFILTIILLIVLLTVIAKFAENKIAHLVIDKIEEDIKAPVNIDKVSFSLLRQFPQASIKISGIYLGACDSVAKLHPDVPADTILYFGNIFLKVKTKALLYNKIEVLSVLVKDGNIKYDIYNDGTTNIDFLMPTETDSTEVVEDTVASEPINVLLKEFVLRNVNVHYTDDSTDTRAFIHIPEIITNGQMIGDQIAGFAKGSMELSNLNYPETNLSKMNKTKFAFDLGYEHDSVTINNLKINTDGAYINLKGKAFVGDEIYTNMNIDSAVFDLGELTKYAPSEMLDEYGIKKIEGIINMNMVVNGVYSDSIMPKVDVKINMKGGNIVTTEYPELKNISFAGKVTNGDLKADQSTEIVFKTFRFETNKSKFSFSFSVLDIEHPVYKVKANLSVNLGEFNKYLPDSSIKRMSGNVDVKLATRGVLPDSIGDDFTDYVLERTSLNMKFNKLDINVDDTLIVNDFYAKFDYTPNPKRVKINDLAVKVPSFDVNMKNTSMDVVISGKTINLKKLGLNIKSFHLQNGSNVIKGKAKVYNIDKPEYNINTSMHLDLAELMPFVPDSMMNSMTGILDAEIHSSGIINLNSIEQQSMSLLFKNSQFNCKATGITVDMLDEELSIKDLSMLFVMKGDTIDIDDAYGNYRGLEFWADSTQILNVYETIIEEKRDKQLIVYSEVRLGTITNEFIAPYMAEDATTTDESIQYAYTPSYDMRPSNKKTSGKPSIFEEEKFITENSLRNYLKVKEDTSKRTVPESLLPNYKELGVPPFLMRGTLSVKKLEYEKNVLDDISMKFRFSDSLYVIDQMKFKMCDGDLNTSLLFDARNWKRPRVDIKNITSNFNIQKFLKDNDNFGDTALTYEKVNGIYTGELHTRFFLIGDSVPTNKIRVKGHFELEDGHIYDYEPLSELSTSIGGLKELDNLDFNTLKADLFMFKDKVYIPKTDIVSSALDMSLSAMYNNANEDYESHIIMHLGDVLTGKSDRLMKKQEELNKKNGGTIDRKGLNLLAMDVDGKSKYGIEVNKKLKKKFNNQLNKQRGFLRLLFNPALVNFSTDMDRVKKKK